MKLLSVLAAGTLALAATASTLAGQPDDKHCAARAIPVLEFAGVTLRSVTTPKGKTTFRYEHGFLKQIQEPDGRSTSYAYGADGRLALVTLADGETQLPEYDTAGRLARLVRSSGPSLALKPAPDGRGLRLEHLSARLGTPMRRVPPKPLLAGQAPEARPDPALTRLLIAIGGWERSLPVLEHNCDELPNTQLVAGADVPKAAACPVVDVTGDRPYSPGFGPGEVGGDPGEPGTGGGGGEGGAPRGPQDYSACIDDCYIARDTMQQYVCNKLADPNEHAQCTAANERLLNSCKADCKLMFNK